MRDTSEPNLRHAEALFSRTAHELLDAQDEMRRLQALIVELETQRSEAISETARTVDELAFWKHQAIWHRAWCNVRGDHEPDEVDMTQADRELERARAEENRERGPQE